jgi:hypothetical protein
MHVITSDHHQGHEIGLGAAIVEEDHAYHAQRVAAFDRLRRPLDEVVVKAFRDASERWNRACMARAALELGGGVAR